MSDTPETIYLIPDYDEGVLGHVWCDDPAPGIGMEPADAIEYRRADTVDTELTAAKARIKELEKALGKIKQRAEAYIEADAPMQPDSSVMAINDICAAALLKEAGHE